MSDEKYTGPGKVKSAVGEGAVNAAVYGGVAAGATKFAIDKGVVEAVGNHGIVKSVGEQSFVKSAAGHVQSAASRVASHPRVADVAGKINGMHLPNGTQVGAIKGSGRAALIVGGTVAAVGGVIGLANGWNRASEAKQSWRERVGQSNNESLRSSLAL